MVELVMPNREARHHCGAWRRLDTSDDSYHFGALATFLWVIPQAAGIDPRRSHEMKLENKFRHLGSNDDPNDAASLH